MKQLIGMLLSLLMIQDAVTWCDYLANALLFLGSTWISDIRTTHLISTRADTGSIPQFSVKQRIQQNFERQRYA